MQKHYIKPFLIIFISFFASISCDRQIDSSPQLSADKLLKDKEFLSFMSSVDEARYKIIYRQRDLGTIKGVANSLEKIKSWSKNESLVLKNKSLITRELGFNNLTEYEQIEKAIQHKRTVLINKYPELLNLSSEQQLALFKNVIEKWNTLPQARSGSNDLCTSCFFNNCNYCNNNDNDGYSKSEIESGGGGEKCAIWQQNCRKIRDGQLGEARAVLLAELIAAGVTGIETGTNVAAGTAPIIGPFASHAGAAAGILSSLGIAGWATYIYFHKVQVIEAEYNNCLMDGPCN